MSCREQIARFEAHLFAVPRLGPEHIAIGMGSTQLTHDLFRTLLDPGDTVMLLDPTYANYEGQLAFVAPGLRVVRLPVLDRGDVELPAGQRSGGRGARLHAALRPAPAAARALRRARQPHQPGRAAGARRADARAHRRRGRVARDRLRLQVPVLRAAAGLLRAGRPPTIPTWSPSTPTRSGRAGWAAASAGSRRPRRSIDALERVQQCSILCPDTLVADGDGALSGARPSTTARCAATWTRPTCSTAKPRA